MRKSLIIVAVAAMLAVATPALAELQTVQVGGEIRIRANYYSGVVESPTGAGLRWPGAFLPGRSIGTPGNNIISPFAWSDKGNDLSYVESRVRLNVSADFTDEVAAFIELDSYDIWGEDFRSNYITGADARAATADDVEVYQAFIEANEMFGTPLRLRIGRQELSFGSEWLVGVNDTSSGFTGLSFDAIRLTYATDMFSVDAVAAQLFESGVAEQDGDVWFYGLYGSYTGIEDITIDAYWMWVRDARRVNDTNGIWFTEWLEDIFGLDDYDVTNLHTIGLRGAGTIGAFDFEAEAAYQFGDAGQVGSLFAPFVYGDDSAEFDSWGANLELGYTLDIAWQPRFFLGGAYLGGEDNRDINFWEWIWPFNDAKSSVSFNRLFSNWEYSEFLENTDLSNAWLVRGGVSAMPTESLELLLTVSYFEALEEFRSPVYFTFGGFKIPIAPVYSFWTQGNGTHLGWEAALYATYHYTEDLTFEVGYAHFFVGDGLANGSFSALNGLGFNGGRGDDNANYLYVESRLAF
jgi:hypothetical protein